MNREQRLPARENVRGGIFHERERNWAQLEQKVRGGREHRAVVEPLEIWGPGTQQGFWEIP